MVSTPHRKLIAVFYSNSQKDRDAKAVARPHGGPGHDARPDAEPAGAATGQGQGVAAAPSRPERRGRAVT